MTLEEVLEKLNLPKKYMSKEAQEEQIEGVRRLFNHFNKDGQKVIDEFATIKKNALEKLKKSTK